MAKTRRVRVPTSTKETKPQERRYSFSQISLYQNCPRKYRYRYVDQIPTVPGVATWLSFGKKGHEYIEQILTARLQHTDLSGKIRNEIRKRIAQELKDDILEQIRVYHVALEEKHHSLVKLPEIDVDSIAYQLSELTIQWDTDVLPEIEPIAVEQELNITIGGAPFIMYIDLIHQSERGPEILDWKFTTKAKGQLAAHQSLQLSIYGLATRVYSVGFCALIRPVEGKEAKWKPRVQIDRAMRTDGEFQWAEQVVSDSIQAIRAGVFPVCSTENFLCNERFCDYWTICRGRIQTTVDQPDWFDGSNG